MKPFFCRLFGKSLLLAFALSTAPGEASQPGQWIQELDSGMGASDAVPAVVGVSDDVRTGGNWRGRYGKHSWILCGMAGRWDYKGGPGLTKGQFKYRPYIGENRAPADTLRSWVHWAYLPETVPQEAEVEDAVRGEMGRLYPRDMMPWQAADVRKVLLNPVNGGRRQSSWDDHAEAYRPWFSREGPNMYVDLEFPQGQFLLSFYFVNKDSHAGKANRYRDYQLQIKQYQPSFGQIGHWEREFDAVPTLAEGRVTDFYSGLYKRFVVRGPAKLTARLHKGDSINTVLSGVFVDEWIPKKTGDWWAGGRGLNHEGHEGHEEGGVKAETGERRRKATGIAAEAGEVVVIQGRKWLKKGGTERSGRLVPLNPGKARQPGPATRRRSAAAEELRRLDGRLTDLKAKSPARFMRLAPGLAGDVGLWALREQSESITGYHDRLEELIALFDTLLEFKAEGELWKRFIREVMDWAGNDESMPFAERKRIFGQRCDRMEKRGLTLAQPLAEFFQAYFSFVLSGDKSEVAEEELVRFLKKTRVSRPRQTRSALVAFYEYRHGPLANDMNFVSRDPEYLYSWALCHRQMDHHAIAAKYFGLFLQKAPNHPMAKLSRKWMEYEKKAAVRTERARKQKFYVAKPVTGEEE